MNAMPQVKAHSLPFVGTTFAGALGLSMLDLAYELLVRFFTDTGVSVADQLGRLWIGVFIETVIVGTIALFIKPDKWHPAVWITMAAVTITFPWRRGIPIREFPGENLLSGIGLVITLVLFAGIIRLIAQRINEAQS
jgi:hypothetical protein